MSEGAGALILTVDDDSNIRRLIERFLKSSGYDVLSADTGQNALRILNGARPDLILLDGLMPGMDGYQLCAELQGNEDTAFIDLRHLMPQGLAPSVLKEHVMKREFRTFEEDTFRKACRGLVPPEEVVKLGFQFSVLPEDTGPHEDEPHEPAMEAPPFAAQPEGSRH